MLTVKESKEMGKTNKNACELFIKLQTVILVLDYIVQRGLNLMYLSKIMKDSLHFTIELWIVIVIHLLWLYFKTNSNFVNIIEIFLINIKIKMNIQLFLDFSLMKFYYSFYLWNLAWVGEIFIASWSFVMLGWIWKSLVQFE